MFSARKLETFGTPMAFFSSDGTQLWATVLDERRRLAVTSTGIVETPELARHGQQLRSGVTGEITMFWSGTFDPGQVEGLEGETCKVAQYSLADDRWGPDLELDPPDAAAFARHVIASPSGRRLAAVLSKPGAPTELVIWDLKARTVLRRHELAIPGREIDAMAFGTNEDRVLGMHGGALHAWPITGAPSVGPVVKGFSGFRSSRARWASADADLLPVANGHVLVHGVKGLLALLTEAGKVAWSHRGAQAYCATDVDRSRAAMSPSGNLIVAAVSRSDAVAGNAVIEVFGSDGTRLRLIPWSSGGTTVVDVAITDAGWIALATNKLLELFPPADQAPAKKPTTKKPAAKKPAAKPKKPAAKKPAAKKR